MALKGIQVLELAGLAPAPFCGMVLSDFGAKVIRVDKISGDMYGAEDIMSHGKLSVALNLKTSEGVEALRKLSNVSDVLIDSYRPGVMEKLKLGPSELLCSNKRLIYARLTGYGQDGPLANAAGHDLNYSSISGALSFLGTSSEPIPPVNLLADFAGGGFSAAFGIVMALYERERLGLGQVVDCSMTRGAAYISSFLIRGLNTYLFSNPRGENMLDGGLFFYNSYKTKDNKWMAVGALEPKFYADLLKGLGIDEDQLPQSTQREIGAKMLREAFALHDQQHWIKVFSSLDACVTPVLSPQEAVAHKHNQAQKSFDVLPDGTIAPTPEPRLSRNPGVRRSDIRAPVHGEHTLEILKDIGYSDDSLSKMLATRAIYMAGASAKL